MLLYSTIERSSTYGKQNYSHYEYRLEDGQILKYRCRRQKVFYSDESEWVKSERLVESWKLGDPGIPEWLNNYLPE